LVLEADKSKAKDKAYFDAICKQMDTGGASALLYMLLHRKITQELRKAPRTSHLWKQVEHGLDSMDKWWHQVLEGGRLWNTETEAIDLMMNAMDDKFLGRDAEPWAKEAPADLIHSAYLSFCMDIHESRPVTRSVLIRRMRKNNAFTASFKQRYIEGSRYYCYTFVDEDVARNSFEEGLGQPLKWQQDDGEELP